MDKEKQIEEMAKELENHTCMSQFQAEIASRTLHTLGYRKIYDDHQRQCTCYALGCQMAEELKKEVAMEIFEELEKSGLWASRYPIIAELEKKYTESEKDK